MEDKIFILDLEPKPENDVFFPKKIIIRAYNEEEARRHSPSTGAKLYQEDSNIHLIENPFSNPNQSRCSEMKSGKDYEIKNIFDDTMSIILNKKKYILVRNLPLDFDSGDEVKFLTKKL